MCFQVCQRLDYQIDNAMMLAFDFSLCEVTCLQVLSLKVDFEGSL